MMTRDELIRMAVQCNLVNAGNREGLYMDAIAEFAELVALAERNRTWTQDHWTEYERGIAAAEREACAEICDNQMEWGIISPQMKVSAGNCADLIRARGGRMKEISVGYTGWFSWPAVYCRILEIDGDKLRVELRDGGSGWISADDFTPQYFFHSLPSMLEKQGDNHE